MRHTGKSLRTIAAVAASVCLLITLYNSAAARNRAQLVPAGTPPATQTPATLTSAKIPEATKHKVLATFGQLPLYFIENRGQLDPRVAYYVQGAATTVYLASKGVTFALSGKEGQQAAPDTPAQGASLHSVAFGAAPAQVAEGQRWVVKLDFIGANPNVHPIAQDPTPATISYFKGNRDQWKTGLKTYATVVYLDLWPGIDLIYSGTVNRLKYTFVVKPGADPQQIKLAYRGATAVRLTDAGQLEVSTPVGGFHDEEPYAYQEVARERVDVAAAYALEADAAGGTHAYGFRVGAYDTSKPLVIDPAVLVYAGYIGGSSNDVGQGIAVDSSGNAYVTGFTGSDQATFPVTGGPDTTYNGGSRDAFVAKVKADGTGLVYAGYIGGSDEDTGTGIAVDGTGNAYVTGFTASSEATFPVTVGPDLTFNGNFDAFVAKVNVAGTGLIYAGYIGGSSGDSGVSIAVDGPGNAYVTGRTNSTETTFPVTVGPDLTYNLGLDAFVVKVKADGTGLVYAGYIGGSSTDVGVGIATDGTGSAYVSGATVSTQASFPVTVGPDLTYNGGSDAFVAKVNVAGTGLVYAGYIGGSGSDLGRGIAVDITGNAFVTGQTSSTEASFPKTVGPDLTFNGNFDAFVAKVNVAGTGLDYAGYIGGSSLEDGNGIAVDGAGNAYVTGFTGSDQATFPVTGGPDTTYNGGSDAFVAKVKVDGTGLIYAGYIGGSSNDSGVSIAVDGPGNAYVTGNTLSTEASFPVTAGPDLSHNGGFDAFVAKITEVILTADLSVTKTDSPDPIAVGQDLTYTITVTNHGPDPAPEVSIADELPNEAAFVSASASQGGCVYNQTGHAVTCALGVLLDDSTATVTIVVRPIQGGTITNMVSVTSIATDPYPDDNTATENTVVHGPPNTPEPPACNMVDKPPQAKKPPICP